MTARKRRLPAVELNWLTGTLDDDDLMALAAADGLGIAFVSERNVSLQMKTG
jgi:hypothetical protein